MGGRFLFVAWDGGGNLQPMLGLARMLSDRGHRVRTLAWGTTAERVAAAGSEYVPIDEPTFDRGIRTWEEQEEDEPLFCGAEIARTVRAEAERLPADAVVVDFMLRGAFCGAEASGHPTVALVHTQRAFFDFPRRREPEIWGWDFPPVNTTRARLGLDALPLDGQRVILQLQERCAHVLSVMPREFERPGLRIPPNVRHVGPIFEEAAAGWPDDLPWSPDDPDPLVVVSFSTTYMRHEGVLARILEALDPRACRVLVTLGTSQGALTELEVPSGPWVTVPYVPHLGVLPHASLVVTHAGMGTVMAAFAFGVPMVCFPMGRDQFANSERVQALGAGVTVEEGASVPEITAAVDGAMRSESLRAGARRMAEITASYGNGSQAVEELEGLLSNG